MLGTKGCSAADVPSMVVGSGAWFGSVVFILIRKLFPVWSLYHCSRRKWQSVVSIINLFDFCLPIIIFLIGSFLVTDMSTCIKAEMRQICM
jgi:hypothetical protein